MIMVGLAFAFVALVWIVLEHVRLMPASQDNLKAEISKHIDLALASRPKGIDHSAELAALTKQVETLKAASGLKQIR